MQQPVRYIHIGYPKAASTALQTHLFAKHGSLYHLGAGSGGTVANYIDDEMMVDVEVSLRTEKESVYQRAHTIENFERHFVKAKELGKLAVGLSSESLSFTMHHDIDPAQKAARLQEIFGQETRIIIVIRNQWDLLKSLYREYVLGGLHLDYAEFAYSIYYNQARSCLYDLNYAYTITLYRQLFGADNVLVVTFEDLQRSPDKVLGQFQQHLEIPVEITRLPKANTREDDVFLETVRRLNCAVRPNHARSVIEPIGAFRYPSYFEQRLGVPVDARILEDQRYIDSIRDVAKPASLPYPIPALDYSLDPLIEKKIDELFGEWNKALDSLTAINTFELGYPY